MERWIHVHSGPFHNVLGSPECFYSGVCQSSHTHYTPPARLCNAADPAQPCRDARASNKKVFWALIRTSFYFESRQSDFFRRAPSGSPTTSAIMKGVPPRGLKQISSSSLKTAMINCILPCVTRRFYRHGRYKGQCL